MKTVAPAPARLPRVAELTLEQQRPAPAKPGASLLTVGTPALVIDRRRLDANLRRMASAVQERGVALRPHAKTVKSQDIMRRAQQLGITGLTVSTLREAEYFFAHGFCDIFYAVAIGPGKLDRAARLIRAGARLLVAVDSADGAKALTEGGRRFGVTFEALLEIDCGGARCGVPPSDDGLFPVVRALDGAGAKLAGIFTYAGYFCAGSPPGDFPSIAAAEAGAASHAAQRLRAAGYDCPIVSAGSSSTSYFIMDTPGVTEVRCGVYMFGDLFQAATGVCRRDDIALSVLTEVIAHQPGRNFMVVDAGALALSQDRSTQALGAAHDCGYGLVMDLDGKRVLPGLQVTRVWQEHALIASTAPIDFDRFPIGTRLRILPNHSCLTAAAHDRYHVVEDGARVIAEWPRINGW